MRTVSVPIALALTGIVLSAAHAQQPTMGKPGGPGAPAKAGGKNEWYTLPPVGKGDIFTPILLKLKLERKQIPKLRPWLIRVNGERDGIMKNAKLSPEDKKKKVQTSNEQMYRLIDNVLLPAQKPVFVEALKKAGFTPPAARP